MTDVYTSIPSLSCGCVTLRPIEASDLEGLLRCYSDEKSVPLFNSDNCNGDDFHYTTQERMRQAMDFWEYSYNEKYFVRWTVLAAGEIAGTVEMFRRDTVDLSRGEGVLRIDLASAYERTDILDCILEIVRQNFYLLFDTDVILTKAVPLASARIASLRRAMYRPLEHESVGSGHYFARTVTERDKQDRQ